MEHLSAICPPWLASKIEHSKGVVSFYSFMDWVLNDPIHGAYATGRLRIGKEGDFVTSPSLGPDFSELLAIQISDWLIQLKPGVGSDERLTLVEVGSGEGHLVVDLVAALKRMCPSLVGELDVILVEENEAMAQRQREKLSESDDVSVKWSTFEELALKPVTGVLIMNEVLDALPVDRLTWHDNFLFRQGICLKDFESQQYLAYTLMPMKEELDISLQQLGRKYGFSIPPYDAPNDWTTEWHTEVCPFLEKASNCIKQGPLLVIDYCLESRRYYSSDRPSGTLISYQKQQCSGELLLNPGFCDLTSHLCLETLFEFAKESGWRLIGHTRQGQALLALGLAERLHSLQNIPSSRINLAFERRESLLRLVDPSGLGEFRWIAFQKEDRLNDHDQIRLIKTTFLEEPIL